MPYSSCVSNAGIRNRSDRRSPRGRSLGRSAGVSRLLFGITLAFGAGLVVTATTITLLRSMTTLSGDRIFQQASPLGQIQTPRTEPTLRGFASAIDGDTLTVGPVRVRLFGIDAPESRQLCQLAGQTYPCGQVATAELQRILSGAILSCDPITLDQFRRIVARCRREDGLDVGEELVSRGWALAYQRFSDAYLLAETIARSERRGIWAGDFSDPERFRARR